MMLAMSIDPTYRLARGALGAAALIVFVAILAGACSDDGAAAPDADPSGAGTYVPRVREYSVATVAEDWNYAPAGRDPLLRPDAALTKG
jgi:hypothetical protein